MAMMNEMEYRTIGKALAGGYRAAVYCRLSKDDDLQGESASIANQRDMLEKYCQKQGWEVVAVYQDDGFTGLNMERPDLQRMLRAIERRQINLVITKDLSRLGRNYLQTGHLIEDFFPRNGVRYIAMNDGIDTLRDNNDIAPFKNILNEMYSKDISKKVHSSYLLKAQKGQFTGCLAPFGYRKDPEDKNHLLIDEETAPIVRLIFGYALNGHGPNYIRRRLEEEIKIPRPSRGFFIDGYNPLILAYTSRRVSTICQPRRFCYLLPVNGFKSSPSSTVLQLCLHLAGGGYTLLFSLHFCLPYLHSILGTKIPDFGTYIATLDTSHKSSGYFSLSDIP